MITLFRFYFKDTQELLTKFIRKKAFDNVTKMISECSRLQEIRVKFDNFPGGDPPSPQCEGVDYHILFRFYFKDTQELLPKFIRKNSF